MSALSNPKVGGPVIGVVLLLAAFLTYRALTAKGPDPGGRPAVTEKFYYDTAAKKVILHPIDQPVPTGAVRAYVYSCGDCADESQRITSFLEKVEDETVMVRAFDSEEWVARDSEVGTEVRDVEKRHPCGTGKIHICLPGRF